MTEKQTDGTKAAQRVFISPNPTVRVRASGKWKCPLCKCDNDEGDSTCLACGQDVDHESEEP